MEKPQNAIGLVAVSKHRGLWRHRPPTRGLTEEGRHRLERQGGRGVTRIERGRLQFMGHTAVVAMARGELRMVRGFRPHGPSWLAGCRSLMSWCLGVAVQGSWHDDRDMTHDPTAICYYIPVEEKVATRFQSFAERRQQVMSYRARPTGSGNDNCVSAAVGLMLAFAMDDPDLVGEPTRSRIEDISKLTWHVPGGTQQGHMIRNILNDFQGVPLLADGLNAKPEVPPLPRKGA